MDIENNYVTTCNLCNCNICANTLNDMIDKLQKTNTGCKNEHNHYKYISVDIYNNYLMQYNFKLETDNKYTYSGKSCKYLVCTNCNIYTTRIINYKLKKKIDQCYDCFPI